MSEPAERIELPTPFPVGGVNSYYLEGAEPALLDTGTRTPEAHRGLLAALEGRRVSTVFVSHGHVDHFGQARSLQEEHGARVLVHRDDAPTLRRWDEDGQRRDQAYRHGMLRAGVPDDALGRMATEARRYQPWGQSVRPDRTVAHEERVTLGDQEYQVIHAPGHTPGSSLLRSTDGTHTFTGDTVLETITPNALSVSEEDHTALPTYLSTLEDLAQRDLGRIMPGHRSPFDDHRASIRRALRHAELRRQRLMKAMDEGPSSAYALVEALFPRVQGQQLFLAVSEIIGHLATLEQQGLAARQQDDGADTYSLSPK